MEIAIFAMGCFWGVSVCSGSYPAFTAPPQAIPAAYAKSDLSGSVLRRYWPCRSVRIVYDPSVISYEQLLQVFWRITIPPRECVRAMTTARSIVSDLSADPRTGCRRSRQSGTFQAAMLAADDDRRITTEIANPHRFIMPKMTTSNICIKTRMLLWNWWNWRLSAAGSIALRDKCRLLIKCILFMPDTAETPARPTKSSKFNILRGLRRPVRIAHQAVFHFSAV